MKISRMKDSMELGKFYTLRSIVMYLKYICRKFEPVTDLKSICKVFQSRNIKLSYVETFQISRLNP